jgi:hypothetical protein
MCARAVRHYSTDFLSPVILSSPWLLSGTYVRQHVNFLVVQPATINFFHGVMVIGDLASHQPKKRSYRSSPWHDKCALLPANLRCDPRRPSVPQAQGAAPAFALLSPAGRNKKKTARCGRRLHRISRLGYASLLSFPFYLCC